MIVYVAIPNWPYEGDDASQGVAFYAEQDAIDYARQHTNKSKHFADHWEVYAYEVRERLIAGPDSAMVDNRLAAVTVVGSSGEPDRS